MTLEEQIADTREHLIKIMRLQAEEARKVTEVLGLLQERCRQLQAQIDELRREARGFKRVGTP